MTQEEIKEWKSRIDQYTHYEMCSQWRFSKPGQYPFFDTANKEIWEYWEKRYKAFGGMTSEISKELGW